ncbi:hypothetical protein HPB49_026099 [Dermacentor silvarum]|nr:hypothetical protein HPB49_026099 [Dermacentor silvarum]
MVNEPTTIVEPLHATSGGPEEERMDQTTATLLVRWPLRSCVFPKKVRSCLFCCLVLRGMADTPAVLPLPGDGSPSAGASTRSDESAFSSDGDRVLRAVDLASRGAGPPAALPIRLSNRAVLLPLPPYGQITDILFDTNCKVTNHHRSLILGHLRELIQECADLRAVAARQCGRADELCVQLERTRATGAGVSPGVADDFAACLVRCGGPWWRACAPGPVVPPGGATESAIRRDHAHIMFLTPLVPTSTAADDLSAAMKNNVDLVKERIGDISVRKTPRGLTILSDDKESMDRLRAALESNVVTNTTMSIRFAQKRKPHVKLTGVDPDVLAVNLIAQLNARNPTLTVDPSTCSVRTSFKERSGNFTHVLEVDPPTFRSLMARGRVAVGWTSAAVVEDVHVPTCTFSLALCDSRRTGPCARAARVTTSQLNVRSVWVARLCAAMNAAMRALTARTPRATNPALSWSAELLVCEREPTMADAPRFSTGRRAAVSVRLGRERGSRLRGLARSSRRGRARTRDRRAYPFTVASWIDVSLASLSLTRAGFAWSVSDSDTLSDHRYLEFSFSGMPGILDSLDRSVWFDRVVGCRFSSCMPLTSSWRNFIVFTMPFTHATYARQRLVDAKLAAERSRVRAMRRRLQRTRDPDLRTVFRAQYARTFASYKRNIRHAKDTFDRSLCQELTTRNLFGDPFKLASRLDSVFLLSSGDTFLVPRVGPATYTCQLLKPLPRKPHDGSPRKTKKIPTGRTLAAGRTIPSIDPALATDTVSHPAVDAGDGAVRHQGAGGQRADQLHGQDDGEITVITFYLSPKLNRDVVAEFLELAMNDHRRQQRRQPEQPETQRQRRPIVLVGDFIVDVRKDDWIVRHRRGEEGSSRCQETAAAQGRSDN